MNEITRVCNQITQTADKTLVAKIIYTLCRMITPKFYQRQTVAEMRAAVVSIYAVTKNIRQDVLSKMCELAVDNYAAHRADSQNNYFDINYILSFYNLAWEEARPKEFDWLYRVTHEAVEYCRLDDLNEDGSLKDGAEIWRDERLGLAIPHRKVQIK